MKKNVGISVLGTALCVATLIPSSAVANHRPNLYCSETGDICQAANKVNGIRKLRVRLAAEYFSRYSICVKTPDDTRACRGPFGIQDQGGTYGDSVRWRRHFPRKGPGAYTVTWTSGGSRVGYKVGFHVR